jgi:DNA repair protein RadA/Sms
MPDAPRFVCQDCGHVAHKWMGKCPECGAWNSFAEEQPESEVKARVPRRKKQQGAFDTNGTDDGEAARRPQTLAEIEMGEETRLVTGIGELDRVMGGGITRGALSLIAGDPGIGKSTLMTELGKYLPERNILYVTGEESMRQVKLRAQRLGVGAAADDDGGGSSDEDLLLFAETNVETVADAAEEADPDVLVVDSIQTLFRPDRESAPGSVSQVRESAATLRRLTKELECATFLVGHVTKKGTIAGPRVLEHMVDTVLYFEGDRHHAYRILRSVKNRFGAANEIGVFEMREGGLRPVENPSEIFLAERGYGVSGSTVVCSLEGTRPILVEIQALASDSRYSTPERTSTGFAQRRLQMLLAVLEKRAGLAFSDHDLFLNVAGGVTLDEPAVDLGVAVACASSFRDIPADTGTVLIGEVGLGGEVRSVGRVEPRLSEAQKLGFERAVVPEGNRDGLAAPDGLELIFCKRLTGVLEAVL